MTAVIPDLPSAKAKNAGSAARSGAPVHARARVELVTEPPAPAAAQGPAGAGARRRAVGSAAMGWFTVLFPALFAGASMWTSPPMSLEAIWAKHAASAAYLEGGPVWWLRVPRLAWGVLMLPVAAACYVVSLAVFSPPLAVLLAVGLGLAAHFWW